MKALALVLALAGNSAAGVLTCNVSPSVVLADLNGQNITPATVSASTLTVTSQLSGSVWYSTTAGQLSQDNANFFYDSTNHRLGLGTVTPTNRLTLLNATGTNSIAIRNNSDAANILTFGSDASQNGAMNMTANGSSKVFFQAGGSSYIMGGNVGIGTTAPVAKIHVSSGAYFDGTGSVNIGTMTISNVTAPPNAWALCLSGGQMGHCTSVVGVGGSCTCVAP